MFENKKNCSVFCLVLRSLQYMLFLSSHSSQGLVLGFHAPHHQIYNTRPPRFFMSILIKVVFIENIWNLTFWGTQIGLS